MSSPTCGWRSQYSSRSSSSYCSGSSPNSVRPTCCLYARGESKKCPPRSSTAARSRSRASGPAPSSSSRSTPMRPGSVKYQDTAVRADCDARTPTPQVNDSNPPGRANSTHRYPARFCPL